jgi:hypothetical protein
MSRSTQRIIAATLVFLMVASLLGAIFAGQSADSGPAAPAPVGGP